MPVFVLPIASMNPYGCKRTVLGLDCRKSIPYNSSDSIIHHVHTETSALTSLYPIRSGILEPGESDNFKN